VLWVMAAIHRWWIIGVPQKHGAALRCDAPPADGSAIGAPRE
jgi:hypothetical protein